MNPKKLSHLLVLGFALTITAVGCKHKPPPVTPLPNNGASQIGKGGGGLNSQPPLTSGSSDVSTTSQGITPTDPAIYGNWIPHPDILAAQTIHFDFDKSSIKTSDEPKLEEVATYMKSNPDSALRVEGNCDERGTEEYNRSLGERRALAAREYLSHLGVDPGRVVTISYGLDRPVDTGHNESAWSKNRRDDFVVLTAPNK